MTFATAVQPRSLRVFCLEDNPLIVFHLEHMIEDMGHVFVGALGSFSDLKDRWSALDLDCVLVDIDLADGRTGPDAAAWLTGKGVPSLFVTGQDSVAAEHVGKAVGIVPKPITPSAFKAAMALMTAALQAAQRRRPGLD